jgi:hypothetical protein
VPPFTAEHEQLRAQARAWVEAELAPRAGAWEAAGAFPDVERMAAAGPRGQAYRHHRGRA